MLGMCDECCIVSLVSYKKSGVILSYLLLYNLLEESDAREVLQTLYRFFSQLYGIKNISFKAPPI